MEHQRNPLHLDDELHRDPTRQFLHDDLESGEQSSMSLINSATEKGWLPLGVAMTCCLPLIVVIISSS
jgi:hypothetical protein